MRTLVAIILLFVSVSDFANELTASGVYANAELGFSFTPPPGFKDLTRVPQEKERSQPSDGRTHFSSQLWMVTGPDDAAPDWVAFGIETYPRGRDKDKGDDVTASFFTNHAALPGEATERIVVNLSGRDFAVTRVERKEPPLTKFGVVYTTVLNEQFVSFLFGGNDRTRVEKSAASMNSFKVIH
jgi:hypothetical protein